MSLTKPRVDKRVALRFEVKLHEVGGVVGVEVTAYAPCTVVYAYNETKENDDRK